MARFVSFPIAGSAGSSYTPPVLWESGLSIKKNQEVINANGDSYFATSDHVTSSLTEPGQGEEWESVWTGPYVRGLTSVQQTALNANPDLSEDNYVAGISDTKRWKGEWTIGTRYEDQDRVYHSPRSYVCTAPHVASENSTPGWGPGYHDVWDIENQTPGDTSELGDSVDRRYVTDAEKDALAGTSGTAPSGTNKLVDNADPRLAAGSAAPPDFCPPAFRYKDADELYIPAGRYFKGGYRHGGQYQDVAGLSSYWDVASLLAVDVDGTYSAGTSSGILGGKVNSSWYSVFLVGTDANSVMLLPWVKAKKVVYANPNTVINPQSHYSVGSFSYTGWDTNTDGTNFAGYSLRLKVGPNNVTQAGTRFRLGLLSPTNGNCTIDHVSIGQAVDNGEYWPDTNATPVEITFNSGQHGVTLLQNKGKVFSDWIDFTIAPSTRYVVIIDINASGTSYVSCTTGGNCELCYKSGTASYQNASGGGFNVGTANRMVMSFEVGSNDNEYLTSDDLWNGYRLVKNKIEDPANDGKVYTIADCVSGSPDQILVTGDKTSEIAYGDWLQLVPPSDAPCVYLGTIKFDSSGNMVPFVKSRWSYTLGIAETLQIDHSQWPGTALFALEVTNGALPCASSIEAGLMVSCGTNGSAAISLGLGDASCTNELCSLFGNEEGDVRNWRELHAPLHWRMNLTGKISIYAAMYINNYWYWAPSKAGTVSICGFEE